MNGAKGFQICRLKLFFENSFCILALCFCIIECPAEERLWIEAMINGKPVRLVLDTGSSRSALLPKAAMRLGLAFTNAPLDVGKDDGKITAVRTEQCEVRVFGYVGPDSFD